MQHAESSEERLSAGDTLEFVFHVVPEEQEVAVAELESFGFTSFLQEDDELCAYAPADTWDAVHRQALEKWLIEADSVQFLTRRVIPHRDWNAPWEASIQPVAAGPFLVRPSWRGVVGDPRRPIELIIDPKMSFGTGHHESTRLVLALLSEVIRPGDRVLDAGTGTGILAIAAVKLGAAHVIAFDLDPWIEDNALENAAVNQSAARVEIRIGGIDVVRENGFDAVLANINKNILLAYLPVFAEKVRPGGTLVMAGLLTTDSEEMLGAAVRHGFTLHTETRESEWWAVRLTREAGT